MRKIQIFVQTLSNKTIAINAEKWERIADLKQKIQGKDGIPLNDQRLQFEQKPLQNNKTLFDYKIENNSRIQLAISLNGGSENQGYQNFNDEGDNHLRQDQVNQNDQKKEEKDEISIKRNETQHDSIVAGPKGRASISQDKKADGLKDISYFENCINSSIDKRIKQREKSVEWKLQKNEELLTLKVSHDNALLAIGTNRGNIYFIDNKTYKKELWGSINTANAIIIEGEKKNKWTRRKKERNWKR